VVFKEKNGLGNIEILIQNILAKSVNKASPKVKLQYKNCTYPNGLGKLAHKLHYEVEVLLFSQRLKIFEY
jgi:hypothetical protein